MTFGPSAIRDHPPCARGWPRVLRGAVLATVAIPHFAWAACNLIPQTTKIFDATLGSTNRPFAAPGEPIEVRVRPCDLPASAGLTATATNHLVTVVFTPSGSAPKHAVVLTAAATCTAVTPLLAACQAQLGAGGTATCVAGATAGVQIVDDANGRRLRFLFPDTDAIVGGASDQRTLAGPATIVVTPSTALALPCQVSSAACAGQGGLIACIDELFANDGSCGRGTPHGTFNHFTALPPPNDFQADCFDEVPPCTASATEVRATTDADGNVLLPMDWRGVLVRDANVPVPRLMRATFAPPVSVALPGKSFVASYTPEGGVLPPIFEPEFDPQAPSGDLTLFGSADAPYTVLRIARRSAVFQQCAGGANDGLPCNELADCPGVCASGDNAGQRCTAVKDCPNGTCGPFGMCGQTVCVNGSRAGRPCNADVLCPGGLCGPALFDLAGFGQGGIGPIVLPRIGPGICQESTNSTCAVDATCGSGPCVEYALAAQLPVPLEGLTQTADIFAFALNEAVQAHDLNGDGDAIDTVMTVRDRQSGNTEPIGTGCPAPGCAVGRAVVRTQQPPFSFPAVATDGNVVAFLEPESSQGDQDANGNGQVFDTLLHVYRLDATGATDLTGGVRAVDAAPTINGRAVTVSDKNVFFRTPESASSTRATVRTSIADDELEANAGTSLNQGVQLSADGRYVVFTSDSTNLVPLLPDANGLPDIFVRDRLLNATEIVSLADDQSQGNLGSAGGFSISADGRYVAFASNAYNLVLPDANGSGYDVYVRDRVANSTERVSVKSGGIQSTNGGANTPIISADGRVVAFISDSTDLVSGDTNGAFDLFVHDRMSHVTERASVYSGGGEIAAGIRSDAHPAMSADGNIVAFATAEGLVPEDTNTVVDVYVHDRTTGMTELASVASDGTLGNLASGIGNGEIALSADGRIIAFTSSASTLVPGLPSGHPRIFARDRLAGVTELVSRGFDGSPDNSDSTHAAISADGRFVAFTSYATNIVPNDTNGQTDVFLRDRATGITARLNVPPDSPEADGPSDLVAISADARFVGFESAATNLLGSGNDTNGARDVFVRGPAAGGVDITGDGVLDDTVLQAMDGSSGPPGAVTTLCPATITAVVGGSAAFLRPESAGATPSLTQCAAGTAVAGGVSLNGDGDASDDVVHLWRGSGNVTNLHCAATDVALSSTLVAALVSEAAQGGGSLNGDADTADSVPAVYKLADPAPSSCGAWRSIGQAADSMQVTGSFVVFTTPESAQGNKDLNGDGDHADRVLQIFDANSNATTNTKQAAVEFVAGTDTVACGSSPLIAFRTQEAEQGVDLNGDGDTNDSVLQVWAKGVGVLNTKQAVLPCQLPACDPRQPYRVFGSQVKFLTFECDQGGTTTAGCPGGGSDLNGNGSAGDIVLQVFDACSGKPATVIGAIDSTAGNIADPLAEPPAIGPAAAPAAVFVTASGRCKLGATTLLVPPSCAATATAPQARHARVMPLSPRRVPCRRTIRCSCRRSRSRSRFGQARARSTRASPSRCTTLTSSRRNGPAIRYACVSCPAIARRRCWTGFRTSTERRPVIRIRRWWQVARRRQRRSG